MKRTISDYRIKNEKVHWRKFLNSRFIILIHNRLIPTETFQLQVPFIFTQQPDFKCRWCMQLSKLKHCTSICLLSRINSAYRMVRFWSRSKHSHSMCFISSKTLDWRALQYVHVSIGKLNFCIRVRIMLSSIRNEIIYTAHFI